eukprot:m.149392 g.149392  ORF g.149392 m.149392 type:complete len:622 (-) comp16293_c1_seq1:54-1919(-)
MDTAADAPAMAAFNHRHRRILIQETEGAYRSLQAAVADAQQQGQKRLDVPSTLQHSAQYRAILRSTLTSLQAKRTPALASRPDQSLAQELQALEMTWHLMEIFFLRSSLIINNGSYIIMDLLEWVQTHCTRVDERLAGVLQAGGKFEDHPDFWTCVAQFICQGRMRESAELLQLHSDHVAKPEGTIGRLVDLIKRMPLLAQGVSIADFQSVWHAWQQLCQSRLAAFSSNPNALRICELLAGQVTNYGRLGLVTWLEQLVADLLLRSPLIKLYDLEEVIASDPPRLAGQAQLDFDIQLAVIKQEPAELLVKLKQRFPTFWLPAHVADVLSHSGWFDSEGENSTSRRHEYLRGYAASLLDHPKLWQSGAAYMASIGEFELLATALEQQGTRTFADCRKVLHACKTYGLGDTAAAICQHHGVASLAEGQVQTAINWFLQADDIHAVTRVADGMLASYVNTGELDVSDVTGNLGAAVLRNERMTFIDKYKEVHALITQEQYRQAAEILINILSRSTMAPKWFHIHVLVDALPLLEQDALVFNVDETHTLLQCLQEVELSHNLTDYVQKLIPESGAAPSADDRVRKEKLAAIVAPLRLALSRNMARALLTRSDEPGRLSEDGRTGR